MIELAWRETQQFGQATRRWRWIGPLRMRAGGQQGAGQSVEARIRVRVMSRRLRRSPLKTLCPKCHGQRTTSCLACRGTGKKSIVGIPLGNCKECGGTGRRRCEVCGGTGEVEN